MRHDTLFAECLAHPDDDGPRLVWADAIGGERGELVVLQCALARDELAPAQRVACRERERELLDRHAVAWAGEAGAIAERWCFWRGFLETATLSHTRLAKLPELRAAAPLLGTLTVHGDHRGVLAPAHLAELQGLRGFALVGDYLGDGFADVIPALRGLRALGLEGLDGRHLHALCTMLGASPIQTLQLRNVRLRRADLARVLREVPRLEALLLDPADTPQDLLSVVADTPLRAFQLGHRRPEHVGFLRNTPLGKNLRRLGVAPEQRAEPPVCGTYVAIEDELLHHDPAAMLAIGAARFRRAPAFELVDLDTHQRHVIDARPVFETIWLGRMVDASVVLHDSTVARRHCWIRWNGTHHVVGDHGSSGGMFVDEQRVEEQALVDGAVLQLGRVRLRYALQR